MSYAAGSCRCWLLFALATAALARRHSLTDVISVDVAAGGTMNVSHPQEPSKDCVPIPKGRDMLWTIREMIASNWPPDRQCAIQQLTKLPKKTLADPFALAERLAQASFDPVPTVRQEALLCLANLLAGIEETFQEMLAKAQNASWFSESKEQKANDWHTRYLNEYRYRVKPVVWGQAKALVILRYKTLGDENHIRLRTLTEVFKALSLSEQPILTSANLGWNIIVQAASLEYGRERWANRLLYSCGPHGVDKSNEQPLDEDLCVFAFSQVEAVADHGLGPAAVAPMQLVIDYMASPSPVVHNKAIEVFKKIKEFKEVAQPAIRNGAERFAKYVIQERFTSEERFTAEHQAAAINALKVIVEEANSALMVDDGEELSIDGFPGGTFPKFLLEYLDDVATDPASKELLQEFR